MKFLINTLLIIILSTSSFSAFSLISTQVNKSFNNQEREIEAKLRLAIIADPKMSESARSIRINSYSTAIVLEGHVASRAEKVQIENLARARAGHKKVYNRLTY